jgi:serine/threonine-protein kinase HipA
MKSIVSALTLFGLDDMMARYASYETFAEIIRHRFDNPIDTLEALFSRLVFNVLCGNNDDHARNHAAFWSGNTLSLTPAYDICPQARSSRQASQAMLIHGDDNSSQLRTCLAAAHNFLLSDEKARALIDAQVEAIKESWGAVCDEAGLSEVDRNLFWGRQFLNGFGFEGMDAG